MKKFMLMSLAALCATSAHADPINLGYLLHQHADTAAAPVCRIMQTTVHQTGPCYDDINNPIHSGGGTHMVCSTAHAAYEVFAGERMIGIASRTSRAVAIAEKAEDQGLCQGISIE